MVSHCAHKVFLWDLNLRKRGTWFYDIKQVFRGINKIELYNDRENIDLKATLKHAETVLMEAEKHKWTIELDKQPKLYTYLNVLKLNPS